MVNIKAAVLSALAFNGVALASMQCSSNPPQKDETCFTVSGKTATLWYGRSAWWHAWHIHIAGFDGVTFPVATSKEEADNNRNAAMAGLQIPKEYGLQGTVRDEKPMRCMHYAPRGASVYFLPSGEGSKEGGLSRAGLSAVGDIGGGGHLIMRDNRADKNTPPGSRPNTPVAGKPASPGRSRSGSPRKRSPLDSVYFSSEFQPSLEAREPVYADEESVAGVRMILRRALDELDLLETQMAKRDAYVDEEFAFEQAQMARRDAYEDDYSFGADLYPRDYYDYESAF